MYAKVIAKHIYRMHIFFYSDFVKLHCLVYHLSPTWFLSQKYCEYPYFYDFFTFELTFHIWNGDSKIRKVFLTIICISLSFKKVNSLSCVWLFETPWTGFSRQEYWSGLPFPSPGDLPDSGIEPRSPCIVSRCFTIWATREVHWQVCINPQQGFCHKLYEVFI